MIYPPISQVFARNACLDVLDQLRAYLRSKNENSIKHIGNMLSELGLDHITATFIKCVEEDMICHRCGEQVKLIDELFWDFSAATSARSWMMTGRCTTLPRALGSNFISKKCKKQLELDDICYCNDAKNKCHCNSRTCCTVTVKERGKFT
uniref:Uncharacterized protein n=1 Tax=Globodera rostochiensis TaxID=31243 RepID=A0A914HSU4_GLORO